MNLYENIDVSYFLDIDTFDDYNFYDDGIFSDNENIGIDSVDDYWDDFNDGDTTLFDADEDSELSDYADFEDVIIDVVAKECQVDEDCLRGVSGECIGGNCINGRCERFIQDGFCFINDLCFRDGSIRTDNVCEICNSKLNSTDWSNNDNQKCADDSLECTEDICINRICWHPAKGYGEKCKDGYCDGFGNCVECLSDQHCVMDNLDIRCESYFCDISSHRCKYERRGDGVGCAECLNYYECFICVEGKCVCNSSSFQCETCTPSCGYLKGDNCCPGNSGCSIEELDKTYDCERCCKGICIPY